MKLRNEYIKFAEAQDDLSCFLHPEWLSRASRDGNWNVALSRSKQGAIDGVLSYDTYKTKGFEVISGVSHTPFSGIWMDSNTIMKQGRNYSEERRILTNISQNLPQSALVQLNLAAQNIYCIPFYWAGFELNQRYTFRMKADEYDLSYLQDTQRRHVKKAAKVLKIDDVSPEIFYDFYQKMHGDTNGRMLWSRSNFVELNSIFQGKFSLKGAFFEGDLISTIGTFTDMNIKYYLFKANNFDHSEIRGASALLLHNQMQNCREEAVDEFDFEGSMIRGIHKFFTTFGGAITPYVQIKKYNSKVFRTLREVIR